MWVSRPPAGDAALACDESIGPIERITTCSLGLAAHGKPLCHRHRRLDDALAEMEKAFGTSTLAEILAEPTTSVPLGSFPGLVTGLDRQESSRPR